jgi:aminopeptidase N
MLEKLLILCSLLSLILASPPLQISQGIDLGETIPVPIPYAGVRLPEDVSPLHYDLKIRPIVNLPLDDPEQFTAPGEVTIKLLCLTPTSSITFHASDIDINHDSVTVKYSATPIYLRVVGHSNDSAVATYTIDLESPLEAGIEYELYIPFVSKVGDRLAGLYRSSYLNSTGIRKWLATTQFQKLGARMAFPCWDEPNFKSTFNITLGRPEDYNSLTNGRRIGSAPIPEIPNWVWDFHETTVVMPSYLIAIIVSTLSQLTLLPELTLTSKFGVLLQ